MRRRLRDPRMLNWPPVYQHTNGAISLKARIFTPLRYWIMQHVVIMPLTRVWRGSIGILIFDAFLSWMQVWTIFWFVPFTRADTLIALGAAWALYWFDSITRNSLQKLIIGRTLRVRIKNGVLWIGRKRYLLENNLTFGTQMQQGSTDPIFQMSCSIDIIISQVSRICIIEVQDHHTAGMIVRSLNMILRLAGGQHGGDVDFDPTRRAA